MQLYSGPLSLFTAKVRIALAEKSLDYERIEVPFGGKDGYEPKHRDVLRHNPKAQVPVLIDGDLVLWDSTVIVEYLDDLVPTPPLLPSAVHERARCRMLELHADEVFLPNVLTLIREVFYAGDAESASIGQAREAIAQHHAQLDALLESRGEDYVVGESMTAADVTYRLVSFFAAGLGAPPSATHSALHSWVARMDARPTIKQELVDITQAIVKIRSS